MSKDQQHPSAVNLKMPPDIIIMESLVVLRCPESHVVKNMVPYI